ncbi:Na+/H+-dicarboxylate symporter [Clostridium sp. USBA 49]|uniref:dicarboxylate/amino acid:cation symporter n=1 Tax=Clostridium sp. USBA 49 TaxID=1881060 RepID=UPI000998F5AE|nr:dicarboxylate/amino acid:cation symporter [Clostridium sp. USBA 49]SKA87250.1 Na+/H+-dicarboxylate symporter [Clostridium sp. USBA 49]
MLQFIILIISILLIGLLYFLKTKKISFGNRVLIAMILGIAIGSIFKKNALVIEPIGKIYVNLIKMLVIPLVTTSMISSITNLDNTAKLKSIGFKTIGWLIATTAIASIIGLIVSIIMDPGAGIKIVKDASFKAREIPSFADVLIDLTPSNPVADAANAKIVPVIIFSMFVGIAIVIENSKKPEVIKPVINFINGFAQIMFRITKMILKITPYGVYGLMAGVSAKYGFETLLPLGKFVVAIYIACIIQIILVHSTLITFIAKINPIKFFKAILPAQIVAFTTRSSYGTLPATIKSLTERVKISDRIASFVAPMGASMGMNACGGLYPVMAAMFVARVYNINLNFSQYIILIVVTTIASFGTAGVPGTASIMSTVVLSSMGLPVEGMAMLLGVDTVIDMARTATNVTGAAVSALLVANSEGEFNKKEFNNQKLEELKLTL